ncbi:MAG: HPr family phosphocarrier protein [Lachnospiraceae bacterium]|nr:HPr family phosphocarrier protein [Lachnospiraceae bacterium]
MVSRKVVVENKSGFRVRPASVLARAAETCESKIEILYKYNIINAKSLLNILSVSIAEGDEIELRCIGPTEEKDMEKMLDVLRHLG